MFISQIHNISLPNYYRTSCDIWSPHMVEIKPCLKVLVLVSLIADYIYSNYRGIN
jgi:hypothetical protein